MLGGLVLCFSCAGCTLWKVFNSPLKPVGQTGWQLVGEHHELTGRHRQRLANVVVLPWFADVFVLGRIVLEAEMEPWFVYHTVRRYEREVESLLTIGIVERSVYVTDPDGRGGYPRDLTDLEKPPRRAEQLESIWVEVPARESSRGRVEWTLSEVDGGTFLAYSSVNPEPTGTFLIRMPAHVIELAAEFQSQAKRLVLQHEGQPPYEIEISRRTFSTALRERRK